MRVRRGVVSVIVGAVLAVGASGCVGASPAPSPTSAVTGSPAPAPAGSPSPSAGPSASPTPASSEPATPAFSAADPGTWLIDFVGVGPIVLGASLEQVKADIPLPVTECLSNTAWYSLGGPSAVAASVQGGGAVSEAYVGGTDRALSPKTQGGIGVGSSLEELQAAHPEVQQHASLNYGYYYLTDGTAFINFSVGDDGVVDAIDVSTTEFPPSEICG
jgi:hypothetical protein